MEIDAEKHHRCAERVERMKSLRRVGRCHHRILPRSYWTDILNATTLLRKVPCYTGYTVSESLLVQLRKGVLDLCVLALLARRDGYAYDIASRLAQDIGMGEGTIYPLMRRMQTDGLVKTYLEESSSGPPRKYYQLTRAGHAALAAQRAEWQSFVDSVARVLSDRPASSARTAGGAR